MNLIKSYLKKICHPKLLKLLIYLSDLSNPSNWALRKQISVAKLLMGGELGFSGIYWAKYTKDGIRTSNSFRHFPHFQFLTDYKHFGEIIFHDKEFLSHPYVANAIQVLRSGYYYHGTRNIMDLRNFAKRFVDDAFNERIRAKSVVVRKLSNSSFYQIVDGHHRVAAAAFLGIKKIDCRVQIFKDEKSYVQELVNHVLWNRHEKVLYQPVPVPECSELPLVRNCADRYNMMSNYLKGIDFAPLQRKYFLDLGSYMGYFPFQFKEAGWQVLSVDRDPFAVEIQKIVYHLADAEVNNSDIVTFLQSNQSSFDVTSCLSIIHHYIIGGNLVEAESIMRKISQITNRILFFEMGTEQEKWFRESLKGWNDDSIIPWVFKNTTFDSVQILGKDSDGRGKYSGQFNRTIFAFYRNKNISFSK